MPEQQRVMTSEEFIGKVFSGERDFSDLNLTSLRLVHLDGFREIKEYLRRSTRSEHPLILEKSDLSGAVLGDFPFHYLRGKNARFMRTSLRGARFDYALLKEATFEYADLAGAILPETNLADADFSCANLASVDFTSADLKRVNFSRAYMSGVMLSKADLYGARMTQAYLLNTDLRGAQHLIATQDLGNAVFNRTIVGQLEKEIIERALKDKELFDARDDGAPQARA